MDDLSKRHLSQGAMLDQIEQVLRRGNPAYSPAYTLVLGAGASFGAVPTAKQMLGIPDNGCVHPDCVPAFLHSLEHGKPLQTQELENCVKSFWKEFLVANQDLKVAGTGNRNSAAIELENSIPKSDSVATAYKALFDPQRTAGINSPAGAREYLCKVSMDQKGPIRLNGTHFFLASLLSLQNRKDTFDSKGRPFYVGKRPFARTIFTTNFDPLLQVSLQLFQILYYMTDRPEQLPADALYTDNHSAIHLFYAHGSVHRQFLANTTNEIEKLRDQNARDLTAYLGTHGVIVLGYSGWDDCLLKALNQSTSFAHNLYWLARGEASLSKEVRDFLCSHTNAFWVDIADGGEFMATLHSRLCPGMAFTELLHNPISPLRERLEQVDLGGIPSHRPPQDSLARQDETAKQEDATTISTQETSPNELRLQVLELLKNAESVFTKDVGGDAPFNLLRLEHQADLAFSSRDLASSIEMYDKIAKSSGTSPEVKAKAIYRRGVCHSFLKHDQEASADFHRALDSKGASAQVVASALISLGLQESTAKRYSKAQEFFTKAMSIPNVPALQLADARYFRGMAKLSEGKDDDAVGDFSEAISIAGAAPAVVSKSLGRRGMWHMKMGRTQQAIDDLTHAIEMPRGNTNLTPLCFVSRGDCFLELSRHAEAIQDYSRGLTHPRITTSVTGKALVGRGKCFAKVGNVIGARADFTSALTIPTLSVAERSAVQEELDRLGPVPLQSEVPPSN